MTAQSARMQRNPPDSGPRRPQLSGRLSACSAFLPEHYGRLVDVGCDHASLGIHELLNGRCERLLAIDIEAGPLARARANLERYALGGRAQCLQNDGLRGIRPEAGDCFVIAGMGGLEICDILCDASGLYPPLEAAQRLILQPTKSLELLRLFLLASGFAIVDESLVSEKRRFYVTLALSLPSSAPAQNLKDALLDTAVPQRSAELRADLDLELTDLLLGPRLKTALLSAPAGTAESLYLQSRKQLLQKLIVNRAFFPGLGKPADEVAPDWLDSFSEGNSSS